MRRPARLGTTALSVYLIGVGVAPYLNSSTLSSVLHLVAIVAGVLIWMDW